MSLAERAREAARERPFLLAGLRAGVINHRAAAEFLDLAGDPDAVATALRRFAETLPDYRTESRKAQVTMHSGVGVVAAEPDVTEPTMVVGDTAIVPNAGDATAIVATGDVDTAVLRTALGRLAAADVDTLAAGVGGAALVIAVERRAGPSALRVIEDALSAVPV